MKVIASVSRFSGEYRFLSNFYPAQVMLDGKIYPTVENAYQAAKTVDAGVRACFVHCSPALAKQLGRSVPVRHDWEQVKLDVMRELLVQKFSDPDLRVKLLSTHPRQLVEGNTWGDTYWGVCNGHGQNFLGRLLMHLRGDLYGQQSLSEV